MSDFPANDVCCWMQSSSLQRRLQNPKAYKNAVPSPRIYEFSYMILCVFDDLKKKKGFISSKSLVNETLAGQVIMGRNSKLRILDLHSLIDQEVSRLCKEFFIKSR